MNIEELESKIFEEYEAAKKNLVEVIKEKESVANALIEQFTKEKSAADKRISEISVALDENKQQKEELYAKYKEELLRNDKKEIVKTEEAMRDLEYRKLHLETELEAMSRGYSIDIKQFIADYRKKDIAEIAAAQGCVKTATSELRQMAEELERIINRIRNVLYFNDAYNLVDRDTGLVKKMISIYEMKYGDINVAGHFCGNLNEAKKRFINGNMRGIEDTIAGKILLEELKDE